MEMSVPVAGVSQMEMDSNGEITYVKNQVVQVRMQVPPLVGPVHLQHLNNTSEQRVLHMWSHLSKCQLSQFTMLNRMFSVSGCFVVTS